MLAGVSAQDEGDSARQAKMPGQIEMPKWVLVVHEFQDPYLRRIISPAQLAPGTRYIGAHVEVRNDSSLPLAVTTGQMRLRMIDGTHYQAGAAGVYGEDPRLFEINTLPGERVRGWVYFAVPQEAELVGFVYAVSAPQLLLPLPFGPAGDEELEASPIP